MLKAILKRSRLLPELPIERFQTAINAGKNVDQLASEFNINRSQIAELCLDLSLRSKGPPQPFIPLANILKPIAADGDQNAAYGLVYLTVSRGLGEPFLNLTKQILGSCLSQLPESESSNISISETIVSSITGSRTDNGAVNSSGKLDLASSKQYNLAQPPTFLKLHELVGDLLWRQEKFNECLKFYRYSFEHEDVRMNILALKIAACLEKLGCLDESKQWLRKIKQLDLTDLQDPKLLDMLSAHLEGDAKVKCLELLVLSGNLDAHHRVADAYMKTDVSNHTKFATEWSRIAALMGHGPTCLHLGREARERGDAEKGRKLFLDAARSRDTEIKSQAITEIRMIDRKQREST